MTPDFTLSDDARAALAKTLRGKSLIESVVTPEMEAELARVSVREIEVPTRVGPSHVFVIEPATDTPRPAFVNFHGGGFVRGHGRRDTAFCAQMAVRLGCTVIDVDYRLAPEHPFPQGLHECHDVVAWTFANAAELGIDPGRIALGGHSAGGNFTAAICLMANASGAFRPCAQVLDYPFLDGITAPEDKIDPRSVMPADRMHAFNVLYARVPENVANPLFSPVAAAPEALPGLPPALVIVAGMDPLRHEAQRYAGMLIAAGVDVDVRQYPEADHGFVITAQSDYRAGRKAIFDWLEARFDTSQKGRTE